MRRTRLHGPAALAFAALTSLARASSADDPTDVEALLGQSVVTTASKSAEPQDIAPATTVIITADDLRRYGVRTLNEAINYLAMGVVTTNPSHAVEIGARGVLLTGDYGTHILLLVNGHVINEPWNGTAYYERGAGVPLELVDHVEIALGPGSVLYGSNAMFGVINIVTKRAKDYRGVHLIAESELPISMRAGVGFGTELRVAGERVEATGQLEYYGYDGPHFTFPRQVYGDDSITGQPKRFGPGPGTGVWGGLADEANHGAAPAAHVRVIVGDLDVNLRAAMYERAMPYLDGIVSPDGDFNDPDAREIDRWVGIDVARDFALSRRVSLRVRGYGDVYAYDWRNTTHAAEDCLDGQTSGCRRELFGQSQWAGLELQPAVDWFGDGVASTLVGVDVRARHVGSHQDFVDLAGATAPESVGPIDETDGTLAAYLQQTVQPTRWLSLNAGARMDVDPRFDRPKLSPRAAIAVTPWDQAQIKLIYAEAFRAPSAYEAFYADPLVQVPSAALAPESVRGFELVFSQRFGAHRVLLGGFASFWSDMVSLEALSEQQVAAYVASGDLDAGTREAYQYENLGTIRSLGFNGGVEGSLGASALHYGLNVTGSNVRTSGRAADGSELPERPLTVGPQLFGNARVAYDFGKHVAALPTLGLAVQYLGARLADRAFDGGFQPTPALGGHTEARATLSGPAPGLRGLSYRVSANYAFGDVGPYVVGANQSATPTQARADLNPVDRFRVAVGLHYTFAE